MVLRREVIEARLQAFPSFACEIMAWMENSGM